MKPHRERISLLLLTGFLGSGKTTLLRELLMQPQMADTAVLINELGAVGLDHHLVWGASEAAVVLENGCICCSVRDDLVSSLQDLFWLRLNRRIPRFSRAVIETTGIADPGPIVQALLTDSFIAERYRLDAVITTVDGLQGRHQLDRYWEAVKQVTAADALLITKADLAEPDEVAQLEQQLAQLNPFATRQRISHGKVASDLLLHALSAAGSRSVGRTDNADRWHWHAAPPGSVSNTARRGALRRALHDSRTQSFTLRMQGAVERERMQAGLLALLAQYGSQLLRIKGLVEVIDDQRPVVVQVVGGTLFPLETLAAWPEGRSAARLVFITAELGQQVVREAINLHLPGWLLMV
jgi:G3E family GTPase